MGQAGASRRSSMSKTAHSKYRSFHLLLQPHLRSLTQSATLQLTMRHPEAAGLESQSTLLQASQPGATFSLSAPVFQVWSWVAHCSATASHSPYWKPPIGLEVYGKTQLTVRAPKARASERRAAYLRPLPHSPFDTCCCLQHPTGTMSYQSSPGQNTSKKAFQRHVCRQVTWCSAILKSMPRASSCKSQSASRLKWLGWNVP